MRLGNIASRLTNQSPALPSAGEWLLLRAALFEAGGAREAWEGWRRTVGSIEAVDLPAFRLLPLVYRNLEAAGVEHPDLPLLKGVYRHAWVTNQRLLRLGSRALKSLHEAGIPTMVLKGAAASATHYRDAGARPLDALDILVKPHDARRAIATLQRQEWSMLTRMDWRRVMRSRHATTLLDSAGAKIDLHWRVMPESVRDDEAWSNAIRVSVGAIATLAPGPTDQLLHACAHGVRVEGASPRWIADAAVILRDAGAKIDWLRFVDAAAERRPALRMAASLALLRGSLNAPIPAGVLAQLNAVASGLRRASSPSARRASDCGRVERDALTKRLRDDW